MLLTKCTKCKKTCPVFERKREEREGNEYLCWDCFMEKYPRSKEPNE